MFRAKYNIIGSSYKKLLAITALRRLFWWPSGFAYMTIALNVPGEWTPCQNAAASAFRVVKSVLARGDALIISDGVSVARVTACSTTAHPTGRSGTRVDIKPEPLVGECVWAVEIARHGAAWFLRDSSHTPDLPVVRWYRKDPTDIDWVNITVPMSDVPMRSATVDMIDVGNLHGQDEVQEEVDQAAVWIPQYAWDSVFSSSVAALCTSHHRWWAIPLILGVGSGTVVWYGSHEDGPFADLADLRTNVVSNVYYSWEMPKSVVFWIVFSVISCIVIVICWKVWRWSTRIIAWFEPAQLSFVDNEVDSTVSSAGRNDQHPDLFSPAPPGAASVDGLIPLRQAVPGMSTLFDSPQEDVVVSPQAHTLSGAGVFSSAAIVARCLNAHGDEQESASSCLAHIVFPSDGTDLPLTDARCANQNAKKSLWFVGIS